MAHLRLAPSTSELVTNTPRLPPAPAIAILEKGFRPFFLLAALHVAVFVPIWLAVHRGLLLPVAMRDAASWHAHEMLFGFAAAVLAGFLLTAASNWTGRVTAVRGPLLGLVAAFIAGRVALVVPGLPPGVVAALDLLFLPLLAIAVGRAIVGARSRRNYVFVGLLCALVLANAMTHADMLGVWPGARTRGHAVALDVLVAIVLLVSARIVPMFSKNATGADARSSPHLDRFVFVTMLAIVLLDTAPATRAIASALGLVLGPLVAARARRWGLVRSFRDPLLAILHVGHGFVATGLVLRGVSLFLPVSPAAGVHALAIGAVGCLAIGMLVRVAKGHTGRPLVSDPATTTAFALVVLAALARIAAELWSGLWSAWIHVAGITFSLAFVIYLAAYARLLVLRRADGRPG